ncbi:uncharacterized protein BP5553_09459 [Venustampulla echinocandica]|uniref:Sas10 C-terminal domain-containing protein n=1 Tax=Venustampulla echinocandica TaxID=2656787 RepID=A0A370TCT0_9HELO|nr:uncharacterized protein BP5553_09459 [Venustampulla echinocandica]RDL32057.1 hypothetical protein BP5553_09459 [Venustampulla echinocandica]
MAKKRKASGRTGGGDGAQELDPKGGRMGPITTYEDIADSEDEFHINRDKVMLDDGPDAKRRRKLEEEDALLQPSDEEVLGYSSESSDEDEEGADDIRRNPSKAQDSDEEAGEGEEEDEEGWGTSRKDYYNADEIQTEADALEEEAEAKRLQTKKLQKMTEADFGFDESEWLDGGAQEDEDKDVVTEVLKDIEITAEMGPDERFRILKSRYPEFEFLADEFVALQPTFVELQQQMELENAARKSSLGDISTIVVKCRALAAYMASLTMYFAILTSPSKDDATPIGHALDPAELRDHPVMESLLQCRTLWSKVKALKTPAPVSTGSEPESDSEPEELSTTKSTGLAKPTTSSTSKNTQPTENLHKKAFPVDPSLADLDLLLPSRKSQSLKPPKPSAISSKVDHDSDTDNSDFGEETHLSTKEAAQKAIRKKTLKFYTSQIAQKSNKRIGAGRDAGGDDDLPYRERLRDRQARLNAEAEKRGKKLDDYGRGNTNTKGTDLGAESDGNDEGEKARSEGEDDEYYNMITSTSKRKKAAKQENVDNMKSLEAANALDRVEDVGELDEDGKRAISRQISKNKGLTPNRKKDVRNPRVKKRKKYEEKKKKLGSMKPVWKGGEEKGGYGGEKTGIKAGLVKSRKL